MLDLSLWEYKKSLYFFSSPPLNHLQLSPTLALIILILILIPILILILIIYGHQRKVQSQISTKSFIAPLVQISAKALLPLKSNLHQPTNVIITIVI